jgi:tripartite-type tricarboxylate transporter receptor subunit TctC
MRSIIALFAAALLLPAGVTSAFGQANEPPSAYPSRLIRIVVPYPPGGATDTVTRKIGERLRQRLNWTVVVDNRPGGGTIIGTEMVARAPADGYTLLLNAPAGIVQLPWLQENLPYDPIKDLQPLIMVARVPTALIIPANVPANNFAEFVRYVKSVPDKLSYGSLGLGSTAHIFGEVLTQQLGLDAVHVPYKGDAPAMNDLIPGRLHYMFNNTLSALSFSKQGSVKVLGVTGDRRVPAMADVPTMSELGMPQLELIGWFSIFAPAGVPRPILEKIYAEFNEAVRSPEISEFLKAQALIPDGTGLDDFAQQVRSEHAAWGKLIKAHNIRME